MNKTTKALKAAFPHTVPVFTGFIFIGIAYGILMSTKGYSAIWSLLMSLIAFCGSMQFVAITLISTVFDPLGAFILAIMVNARHLFYGISMLKKYKGIGKIKNFLIYTLCDETFSISYNVEVPEKVDKTLFYFFISFLNYIYWALGSFIGGLLGNVINFNTKGLDFALIALFVVIFIDQWKEQKNRIPMLIGVTSSLFSLIIFGQSNFIIPAMIFILTISTIGRKKLEGETKSCI
jgi:4-azaleucine resistance transporter AzlC